MYLQQNKSRSNMQSFSIYRVRSFVPYETLRSVYMSLVQPHFDYCDSVWGSCTKALANKLQKLQNRAARILTHSNYDANADFLIQQLGWKKLHSQRSIHKAVMIYKSLNGLAPDYLSSKFLDHSSVCNYSLRGTEGKLAVPMPHTNYMKNSFSYSGASAVLWNSLPIELWQAFLFFKRIVKSFKTRHSCKAGILIVLI